LQNTSLCNVQQFKFLSDMDQGKVGCMKQLGITESFVVKRQVLLSASEAAEMILRVDNIIKSAPRKRTQDRGHC
jgi:T-complex protein 1 subunit beta